MTYETYLLFDSHPVRHDLTGRRCDVEFMRLQPNATRPAAVRYEGGVTSYLEVLYNDQQLFDAGLLLAQARLNELLSVVQLYRALSGRWATPVPQNQSIAAKN